MECGSLGQDQPAKRVLPSLKINELKLQAAPESAGSTRTLEEPALFAVPTLADPDLHRSGGGQAAIGDGHRGQISARIVVGVCRGTP